LLTQASVAAFDACAALHIGLVPGHFQSMANDASAGALWTRATEGERRWFLGTLATIRVAGEAVDGRFALIEFLFPLRASPPRHTHPQDESYIVLDGCLTIEAGDKRFTLEAGATAVVPMTVPHTFRVDSETARVLVLSTPAGLERMVRDASVPASAPTLPPTDTPRPSPEELTAIFDAHGQVNMGPPLGPED
jgi:quercetin dioxygenase-like cupin family protein